MAEQRERLNFLLISANPGSIGVVTHALEHSGTRCRLMMVKLGRNTLQYLHREGRYAEAPVPDLIFFDAVDLNGAAASVLKQMKADSSIRRKPIVLLANETSISALDAIWADEDGYTAFSPVELDSFLTALNAIKTRRFMDAISLLENFGFVLVRMPDPTDDSTATSEAGTPRRSSRTRFRRLA
ncbi:MAG: hypothetical protein AAGA44_15950 [Pseudomonadota bacterium]